MGRYGEICNIEALSLASPHPTRNPRGGSHLSPSLPISPHVFPYAATAPKRKDRCALAIGALQYMIGTHHCRHPFSSGSNCGTHLEE